MIRSTLASIAFLFSAALIAPGAVAQSEPAPIAPVAADEPAPPPKPAPAPVKPPQPRLIPAKPIPAKAPLVTAEPAQIVITLKTADAPALGRLLSDLVAKNPAAQKAGITVTVDAALSIVSLRGEASQRKLIDSLVASITAPAAPGASAAEPGPESGDAKAAAAAAEYQRAVASQLDASVRSAWEQRRLTATRRLLDSGRTNDYSALVNIFSGKKDPHAALLAAADCRGCHATPQPPATAQAHGLAARLGHMRLDQLDQPWIGVSVSPVDAVLRGQLKLPDGMGVVITQVVENGPAALGKVQEHDILLSINDQAVAAAEDLDRLVKAVPAKAALKLRLVRGGKNVELAIKAVRPIDGYLDTLIPREMMSRYRIGISIASPDATLRKQLNLAEETGVVVLEVYAGSAAEKAGIKGGDLLLSANEKPLTSTENLTQRVQESAGKPLVFDVLRAGTPLKITVAAVREVDQEMRRRLYLDLLGSLPQPADAPYEVVVAGLGSITGEHAAEVRLLSDETGIKGVISNGAGDFTGPILVAPAPAPQPDLAAQLQRISESLDELRTSLDALRAGIEKPRGGK